MKFTLPPVLQHPKARISLIAGFIIIAVGAGIFTVSKKSVGEFISPVPGAAAETEAVSTSAPQPMLPAPEDLKTLNILLLGYGGPGHEGGYLTDVMQIAHFDFEHKKLAFISIPRDLWVSFPDGQNRKVNAAFALGLKAASNVPTKNLEGEEAKSGAEIVKAVATTITGLPINYFVGIDFVGIQRAVGKLGGIEVDVPETLNDPWYPVRGKELELCGHTPEEVTQLSNTLSGFELEKQFPCRYEQIHYEKGKQQMEGADVLKFTRSRHSSSDFSRSLRQQAVFIGIRDKLLSLNALKDAPGFFKEMLFTINTDINEDIVRYASPALMDIGNFKVIRVNLTTENVFMNATGAGGQYILTPKSGNGQWSSIHQYIQSQIKEN